MSAVKQLGWAEAQAAIFTCFQAKLIPCLVGQSGRGKSALVRQAANVIGQHEFGCDMPNWFNKPDDWDKGVLIEYNLATEAPEDINGLYDVNAMQNEGVTRRIPDERLVYASKHPSIVFFDEADRGRPEIWGAVCSGLAAMPMAIGGVELPLSRAIFAINGETDLGTEPMPEAIKQRVVFIYVRPSEGEWFNYQRGVTSLSDGLLRSLATSNAGNCQAWNPTDLAGEAQAFERSSTRLCGVMEKYLGLREAGRYEGIDADLLLDALAIGIVGRDYWTKKMTVGALNVSPRDAFCAAATLADAGVDADAVVDNPAEADLPPDGLWVKTIEALGVVTGLDPTNAFDEYVNRFPSEGRAALGRAS
jgi:hypothetical protein